MIKPKPECNCNACQSNNHQELFKFHDNIIVKCKNCGLVFVKNPISPQQAREIYEKYYYSGTNGSASSSVYASGERFRTKEAQERLGRIGPVSSILDVGCGMGHFVKAAKENGINAIGIDISENAVKYGQNNGLDLLHGDLLNIEDIPDSSFDVITFWASIEHLYKPKETLEKANRLLKKDGIVVLETGNFDSYLARLARNRWRLLQDDHNFYFTSTTLDNMLQDVGFQTFETENDGFVESIITQFGFRDAILNRFASSSQYSQQSSSSLKEKINRAAGKLSLGDVMIKYAKKI